jgi:hypothetical protein
LVEHIDRDPIGIGSKTREASGKNSIDEKLKTTSLELEIDCYDVTEVSMQYPRCRQDLADFPRLGERRVREDICQRFGQPLEVPQRGRGSMELALPCLHRSPSTVGDKERWKTELRSLEILLDKFSSDPTAAEAFGGLPRNVRSGERVKDEVVRVGAQLDEELGEASREARRVNRQACLVAPLEVVPVRVVVA